jgi:AcrR family transcriptional regulator
MAARPIDAIAIDDLVAAAGVAKGSFFNHFADKAALAFAVGEVIRIHLETRVTAFNADEPCPLTRLTGGMIIAAAYAVREPARSAIMTRELGTQGLADHPLNDGVAADIAAAATVMLIDPSAQRHSVLFWLGCCHTLVHALALDPAAAVGAASLTSGFMTLGLRGLGAPSGLAAMLCAPDRVQPRLDRALAEWN